MEALVKFNKTNEDVDEFLNDRLFEGKGMDIVKSYRIIDKKGIDLIEEKIEELEELLDDAILNGEAPEYGDAFRVYERVEDLFRSCGALVAKAKANDRRESKLPF